MTLNNSHHYWVEYSIWLIWKISYVISSVTIISTFQILISTRHLQISLRVFTLMNTCRLLISLQEIWAYRRRRLTTSIITALQMKLTSVAVLHKYFWPFPIFVVKNATVTSEIMSTTKKRILSGRNISNFQDLPRQCEWSDVLKSFDAHECYFFYSECHVRYLLSSQRFYYMLQESEAMGHWGFWNAIKTKK